VIDETHDPKLSSWVEGANQNGCGFPIQNLPLGVFRPRSGGRPRLGAAIGERILPLDDWLAGESLNGYLSLPATQRRELRRAVSQALAKGAPIRELPAQQTCELLLPAAIGDYSDFYASIHHATNVGRMFRPDNPLLPNYKHVPIAYHGRASSIVANGTPVRRPNGQLGEGVFGPTRELDYELEIGAFLGPGNRHGEPIPIGQAEDHIGGICLLNDWSARDIQRWEYQPLGPFLAKNFATSISSWMVTLEALAPFRVDSPAHETSVLPYLQSTLAAAFDIQLEVALKTVRMKSAARISAVSFRDMYWTLAQLVTHHASNGCPLRAGDLIGSGTVSGEGTGERGCLLELTRRGAEPLRLPSGEERCFLEDGDEVTLTGYCAREGFRSISLGCCGGRIVAAL
jgi:fumarylacetoacetase